MATAVGIIFSNIHDNNVAELTRRRTMASVPFGCRYRLVDFTLSNLVNSDITHVGVVTNHNYESLMDHLGTGKDWDLARRSGGIKLLPPFITAFNSGNNIYNTRLEALRGIIEFVSSCKEDYVILADCDTICNIDLSEILNRHIETGADITVAVKSMYITPTLKKGYEIIESDEEGRVTDIADCAGNVSGYKDVNLNIWVMRRKYLENIILDSTAHGYTNLASDVIAKNLNRADFRVFRYDGYFASINTLTDYYMCSMDLLSSSTRDGLFNVKNRPVYTKVNNSSPTIYHEGCEVRNSLLADGCVIEGVVENSILFRGVKVGKNTVVKNSILMSDTLVGENVTLNCVIADKDVVIRDGRVLSGHETKPFFIDKLTVV